MMSFNSLGATSSKSCDVTRWTWTHDVTTRLARCMLGDVNEVTWQESREGRLCLKNRTNGKDSRVRLRTNFLSITCYAIKGKAQFVGLSYAKRLVWEFGSSNPEGSLFFPFF